MKETEKIQLEYILENHQKIYLLPLILVSIAHLWLIGKNGFRENYDLTLGVVGFLFLIGTLLLIFLKKGLMKSNSGLFKTIGLGKNIVYKKRVDLKKKSSFAVLELNKRTSKNNFDAGSPEIIYRYRAFDIILLNESHTEKELLVSLRRQKNVKKLMDFLHENSFLEIAKYNPKFN